MNRRILFLICTLACSFSAAAQSGFRDGYIINFQNDTLRGTINYAERTRTPTEFQFRASSGDQTVQSYTVQNARKVAITGLESYERFTVTVSMNERNYQRLELARSLPDKTDTVFLEVVIKGNNLNLYAYRDYLKDRFYTLTPEDPTPKELNVKEVMQGTQVSTIYVYRQQLNQIALKYPSYTPEIKRLIESASYSKTSLKKIVSKINTVEQRESDAEMTTYKKGAFFVSAGLNSSNLTYKGVNIINANGLNSNGSPAYRSETKTSSSLPVVSIGYDLFFHPAVQRSFLRTELKATAIKSEVNSFYKFPQPYVEELTNNYKLTGIFVSLDPQLGYNIYNQDKLRIYVSAGVSLRYAKYSKNVLYQDTNQQGTGYSDKVIKDHFNLKSFTAVPLVQAGALISKKFTASLTWFNTTELLNTDNTATQSIKERSLHVRVGYVF